MPDSAAQTQKIAIVGADAGIQAEGGGGDPTDKATLHARLWRRNGELKFVFWLPWVAGTVIAGTWEFILPWKLAAPPAAPRFPVSATAYDASADRYYAGTGILRALSAPPTSLAISFVFGTNVTRAGATVPFTWAKDDWLVAGNALEAFGN